MDQEILVGLLLLLVGLSIGLNACLMFIMLRDKDRRIKKLESELEDLIGRKRQTGPTMAGLEDLEAHLIRFRRNRMVEDDIVTACINLAGQIRQGPYAYNPETPSGERKEFV